LFAGCKWLAKFALEIVGKKAEFDLVQTRWEAIHCIMADRSRVQLEVPKKLS